MLIWAPKSLFKRANQRNSLRRIIRESYRLNSIPLKQKCEEKSITFNLAFNYIAKEKLSFIQTEKAMKKAIDKLTSICEQ